jgi:hypothetical protein
MTRRACDEVPPLEPPRVLHQDLIGIGNELSRIADRLQATPEPSRNGFQQPSASTTPA